MFSRVKVEYTYERTVWWLGLMLGFFVLIYGWLMAEIIFDAVSTGQLANRLERLESEVATLESQYLTLGSKITLDLAHELGFKDVTGQMIFVSTGAPAMARAQ